MRGRLKIAAIALFLSILIGMNLAIGMSYGARGRDEVVTFSTPVPTRSIYLPVVDDGPPS
jgi:ABC-type proline/glycine betaine transport system permease subunit